MSSLLMFSELYSMRIVFASEPVVAVLCKTKNKNVLSRLAETMETMRTIQRVYFCCVHQLVSIGKQTYPRYRSKEGLFFVPEYIKTLYIPNETKPKIYVS